jgi:hypothetical protein
MNTNFGSAIPLSRAAPRVTNRLDEYPHLKHIQPKVDHRGESTAPSVQEQYDSILANAVPKGAVERPVKNSADYDREIARQARTAAAGSAIETAEAKAIDSRIDRLESLIAAQAQQIAQLLARIDVLDGAALGAA